MDRSPTPIRDRELHYCIVWGKDMALLASPMPRGFHPNATHTRDARDSGGRGVDWEW